MLIKTLKSLGVMVLVISLPLFVLKVNTAYVFLMIISGIIMIFISSLIPNQKKPLTLNEFIEVFTHFRIALDSADNVYHALEACMKTARDSISDQLIKLLDAIEHNHTVMPFLEFAKPFNNPFITHVMIHIYLLIDHGMEHGRLWQFNYVFEELIKSNHQQLLKIHQDSYERFNMLLFLGAGVVMITLMINILGVIGGTVGG